MQYDLIMADATPHPGVTPEEAHTGLAMPAEPCTTLPRWSAERRVLNISGGKLAARRLQCNSPKLRWSKNLHKPHRTEAAHACLVSAAKAWRQTTLSGTLPEVAAS